MSDPSGYPPPGQPNPYGQPPAQPIYPPTYGEPAATNPYPVAPDPYAQPAAATNPYAQPVQPYSSQPYSGQPYSGQPYSGQPYSGQPATGQPYPAAVVPPAKKPNTLLWVALGVVLVLLLCCGGVGVWVAVSNNDDDPLVITTTEPSTSVSTRATPSKASTVTLTLPASLGGRPKSNQPAMQVAVETMKDAVKSAVPGAGTTVAAVYGDLAKGDMLMVVGIEGSFPLQSSVLDGLFKGFGTAGEISDITDVPPGPLGGKARCGQATLSGVKVAPCAWIDDGSIGMIFFYAKNASEVKSEFITLRSAIEKKN